MVNRCRCGRVAEADGLILDVLSSDPRGDRFRGVQVRKIDGRWWRMRREPCCQGCLLEAWYKLTPAERAVEPEVFRQPRLPGPTLPVDRQSGAAPLSLSTAPEGNVRTRADSSADRAVTP